jgi:hypothetical protein
LITSISGRFIGSDQLGADENTLPNTTERSDVEVGSRKSYAMASETVVCNIVPNLSPAGERAVFSYLFETHILSIGRWASQR